MNVVNLMVNPEQAEELKRASVEFPSIDLDHRQTCDLELLLNGGYSPLRGFMGRADYDSVLKDMRLANGAFWPMPIMLDIDAKTAASLNPGMRVALRDLEGFMLAVLTVSDTWEADRSAEISAKVTGLTQSARTHYLGGGLQGLAQPVRHDYASLWLTPQALRDFFIRHGWQRVAAFKTQRALHRAEHDFTQQAAAEHQASLLISPIMSTIRSDTLDYHNQMRCYQAVMPHYPASTTTLALLPLTLRGAVSSGIRPPWMAEVSKMQEHFFDLPLVTLALPCAAGVRELLWHAMVYRNHGCTHLIIDQRDLPDGTDLDGLRSGFAAFQKEIGVELIMMPPLVYVEDRAQHMPKDKVPEGARVIDFSGVELRRRLTEGLEIPPWFSYAGVLQALRQAQPARSQRGFTIFFTGLSGAGKSTIAKALMIKLLEMGGRNVTLLDGDVVRKHLSSELGFSKEHRDINVRRIGYVASEITKHGGIAICAPIAPYTAMRRAVREMIEPLGGFFETYICTSIEVCEGRDRKGLYAKARAGLVKEFTGISDPYEVPEHPEVMLDTSVLSVDEAVQQILLRLERDGYVHGI